MSDLLQHTPHITGMYRTDVRLTQTDVNTTNSTVLSVVSGIDVCLTQTDVNTNNSTVLSVVSGID